MIVDCHSHIWPSRAHLGRAEQFSCLIGEGVQSPTDQNLDGMAPAEVALVLGFVSRHLNAEIPNDFIRECFRSKPGRILGFAGIDPTDRSAPQELGKLHKDGFVGIALSPACQNFHPADTRAMALYETAAELSMPVYFLHGEILPADATLGFAEPAKLDEAAVAFPALPMVISHMGFPWIEQTIALLAKHEHVYADVAGLPNKPWQAFRSLTLAYEYGVMEKLLFASDFPNQTVKAAAESLYNVNKITLGSGLSGVPREQLKGIIERDSLGLLGLAGD